MSDSLAEAARQARICNACRYCEGYCSVFPSMWKPDNDSKARLTQLANLCHNCRGCHYACQYTEPHEFRINIPAALARVRTESWQQFAWPTPVAERVQRRGSSIAAALVVAVALLLAMIATLSGSGEGFYRYLGHGAMVALFVPALLLPVIAVGVAVRRYWRFVGGEPVRWSHLRAAFGAAARLDNLKGGRAGGAPAQGCQFEAGDRPSHLRRHAHHATVLGFLLCFASTSSGTVLHYVFDAPAPYPLLSVPKLLGVPGGILLSAGVALLVWLRLGSDKGLLDGRTAGGDMAFVLLLGATGATGLALYAATGTGLVPALLAVHLATVLVLFLSLPYGKMVHGVFRIAALVRDAQERGA